MNDMQSLYLLWATILNQSQKAEQVLLNTVELFNRLGLKENFYEKSTNGICFNKYVMEKINQLKIKNITISFDGGTEESMDYIRGKGTYEKVIDGLEILKKYYNQKYSIKTTLMKNNINEIEELINIAIEYGCDMIKFNCVREDGRAVLNKDNIILSQNKDKSSIKCFWM